MPNTALKAYSDRTPRGKENDVEPAQTTQNYKSRVYFIVWNKDRKTPIRRKKERHI